MHYFLLLPYCLYSRHLLPVQLVHYDSTEHLPRLNVVHSSGFIVGLKPGKATVIVRSEGQTATCRIQVVKPTIRLSKKHIRLSKGSNQILPVWVSSGYHPHFKSTNRQIATVDDLGRVYAKRKGKANIKVSLDGVTKQCNVIIY